MTNDAGDFLHEDLDVERHTEDELKTLLNAFPSALSHLDSYRCDGDNGGDDGDDDDDAEDLLPIQVACRNSGGIPFVPY